MITGKVAQDCWFDNWMAKPPLIDDVTPYSVRVFFEAKSDCLTNHVTGYFSGQFAYDTRMWHMLPTVEPEVRIPDQCVVRWMHIPGGAAYDERGGSKPSE